MRRKKRDRSIRLLFIFLFALTMAYFEASVVVYLRIIAYPSGFSFPLEPVPAFVVGTEIGREAASLIMIFTVAMMSGRNRRERFGCFLFIFGIWDMFYYLILRVLIGWPETLLTWDVIFLIPVVWSGPVLAPVIVAAGMTGFGCLLIMDESKRDRRRIMDTPSRVILSAGFLTLFSAFIWDYTGFVLKQGCGTMLDVLFDMSRVYIPVRFPWPVFLFGVALLNWAVLRTWKKGSEKDKETQGEDI